MKQCFKYIGLFILMISCNRDYLHYNFHSLQNSSQVANIEEFPVSYNAIVKKNKIEIKSVDSGFIAEYEYKIKEDGIFVNYKNADFLIYSFEKNKVVKRDEVFLSTFLEKCELIDIKEYLIDGESYKVYYFNEENSNDQSIDSYFLENEGFICFYKVYDANFIYLNSEKALKVSRFLNDETFFFKSVLERNKQKALDEYYNK